MTILRTDNLVKVYNSFKGANSVNALNGISLHIEKGDFVGIMGASGSGKTTLLNILAGFDTATSGEVFIENNSITKMKQKKFSDFRRKHIGFIFQDFNLLDSLTVEENISLPLIVDKVNAKEIAIRSKELMSYFNIIDLKDKYPYNISGGEKQRVTSARAIINNPSIIFADEPTGNLDSKSTKNVMTMLSKMNSDKESTILMVTHDAYTASFCKKVIFIRDGLVKLEIVNGDNRQSFYDKIIEVLSVVGGEE